MEIFEHRVPSPWGDKTLRVMNGSVGDLPERVDLLVCSAFWRDYVPTRSSLIGALYWDYGVSVAELAMKPELNLKDLGVWVSGPVRDAPCGRIACVEMLDLHGGGADGVLAGKSRATITSDELRGLYDTLFFTVKKSAQRGIPVESLAMHVLGTGSQGIALEVSLSALLTECLSALKTVEELRCITLFDRAKLRSDVIEEKVREATREARGSGMAFISYSHRDATVANLLASALESQGVKPWIDHRMIRNPDYGRDIVRGISQSQAFLLLVSQNSMRSSDVLREVRNASVYADSRQLLSWPALRQRVNCPDSFSYYLTGLDYTDISEPPVEEKALDFCRKVREKIIKQDDGMSR